MTFAPRQVIIALLALNVCHIAFAALSTEVSVSSTPLADLVAKKSDKIIDRQYYIANYQQLVSVISQKQTGNSLQYAVLLNNDLSLAQVINAIRNIKTPVFLTLKSATPIAISSKELNNLAATGCVSSIDLRDNILLSAPLFGDALNVKYVLTDNAPSVTVKYIAASAPAAISALIVNQPNAQALIDGLKSADSDQLKDTKLILAGEATPLILDALANSNVFFQKIRITLPSNYIGVQSAWINLGKMLGVAKSVRYNLPVVSPQQLSWFSLGINSVTRSPEKLGIYIRNGRIFDVSLILGAYDHLTQRAGSGIDYQYTFETNLQLKSMPDVKSKLVLNLMNPTLNTRKLVEEAIIEEKILGANFLYIGGKFSHVSPNVSKIPHNAQEVMSAAFGKNMTVISVAKKAAALQQVKRAGFKKSEVSCS